MQSIPLGSRTFTAARLHRIGGTLRYNDDLIPPGAIIRLVHANHGAASVVLPTDRLAIIKASDINSDNFEFAGPIDAADAQAAFIAALSDEVIPGEILHLCPGKVVKRTGRPLNSLIEAVVPHDEDLTIAKVEPDRISFDTSGFVHKILKSCYFTTAYFDVVS